MSPGRALMTTLTGPTPAPFTGDRATAQQFVDEFNQLVRANLRHLLVTRPELRVELALQESNSYQISRVEGGTGENESEEDEETIETWNWGQTWGQRNPDDRQMEATRQLQRDGDKGSATRAVWRWTKAIQGAETGIGRFRGERPSYLDSIIWSVEKSLPSTSLLNIPFWPLGPWAPEPCSYHFRPTLSWTHEPRVPPAHSKLKGAGVCATQAHVTGAAPWLSVPHTF
ncbi:hypothetical protein EDB84DRAFT_1444512 [Lactarius hengduanensis]|nr:hypothetical protein EDB84DRAFT_1444512 [Lactarius hengduanensis]